MRSWRLPLYVVLFMGLAGPVWAANNPLPQVDQPLVPASAIPGGSAFTLTVHGSGFVSGAVVDWNGSARTTTFVSAAEVTATITTTDLATGTTATVTVKNPSPGGGVSNPAYFEVATPAASLVTSGSIVPQLGSSNVSVADFNGDGKPDIASPAGISLGNGDGSFRPPIPFPATVIGGGLAVGDLNNDGKIDLIVETSNFNYAVLLGNGDGSFQVPIALPALGTDQGGALLLGDFDGDGTLDLAAAGPIGMSGQTVSLYHGNGDGTFGAAFFSTMLTSAHSFGSGDLNNDGKLDLAVCETGGQNFGPLAVFLGNGDGTFQPPNTNSQCNVTVAFADLNGDGILDELSSYFLAPNAGSVNISLGNGDGTFTAESTPFLAADLAAVTDLNGDGKIDLVGRFPQSSHPPDPAGLGYLLGNGDGLFQTELFTAANVGAPIYTVANGDFNGDGKMDLLAVDTAGHLWILLQGVAPVGTVTPATISFGSVNVGASSAAQTLTLTNTGTASLTAPTISLSGPDAAVFKQTNNCTGSIAPGANCQAQVVFTPTSAGARTASVTFSGSGIGGAAQNAQVIPFSGTGAVFSLAVSGSTTASVAPGQTANYTISITPSGFTGSPTFTCGGAPPRSTCTVTPTTLSLDGSTAQTVAVQVATTTGSSGGAPMNRIGAPRYFTGERLAAALGTLGFLLSLLFWTQRGLRHIPFRSRRAIAGATLFLLASAILVFEGCNSGASGTPAGTYTLTLTGNAPSGSTTVTQTTSFSLTVQ